MNIAVIGCGRIAHLLENDALRYKPCTHIGALRYWQKRDKKLVFAAFCDPSLTRAKAAADYAGARHAMLTNDFREIIAAKPDVLVVAASTASHFTILSAALKANTPRIVMEKPVTFSAAETTKLKKLLRQSGSVVLPNYERRYHVKYLQLKKRLQNEDQSHSYRAFFAAGGKSLYAERKNGDEGVLLHDTTHLLDLAQFLFGKITRHETVAGKRKHLLYLEHADGSAGVIETSLGVGAFHLELEIHLKKERVIVGNGFMTTEKIQSSPHYRNLRSYALPVRKADAKFPLAQNPFVRLYHEVLYGRPDNAHFLEALQNVEILSLL